MPSIFIDSGCKVGAEVEVTKIGPDLFRVEEIALFLFEPEDDTDEAIAALSNYKDVIFATPTDSGNLKFVRVHERGGFTQRTVCLPKSVVESTTHHKIQELIAAYGGISVVDFEGAFTYAVPDNQFEAFLDALGNLASEA